VKRVLVINIARMGDLLQSSPLIRGLKSSGEEVEVTLLVSAAFRDVAVAIPGVDHLVSLSLKGVIEPLALPNSGMQPAYRLLKGLTDELQSRHFDRVINITHTHYSAVLTALAMGAETTGMSLDNQGYRVVYGDWANYYFNSCLNRAFNRFNLVDLHCRIAGVKPAGRLYINLSDESRREAADLIDELHLTGRRLVGLVPGASTPEKQWPVELFAEAVNETLRMVGFIPVIFGSPRERGLGDRLAALLPEAVNLCGRTTPIQLAALLDRCQLCITNDTGPMHVAATVGTPVIDISLGSALSHETAPYGEGHMVVEPCISCYPCHPKLRCTHLSCHPKIPPSVVARLAAAMLDGNLPARLPDDPEFASVNIFRTGFDPDGWWELTPILQRPLTRKELFNQALREMWKRALDGMPPWAPEYHEIAARAGLDLIRNFNIEPQITSTDWANAPLSELVSLADNGLSSAMELTRIGGDTSQIDRITRLGARLRETDLGLIRLGYGNPELMPLVAQFTFGKDNMSGWQLASLARQTAELYRNLAAWGRALPDWVAALSWGVKQAVSAEAAA